MSARGSVFGINFYADNNITFGRDTVVEITEVHAGAFLDDEEVDGLMEGDSVSLPNTVPRACGVDLWNMADVTFGGNHRVWCMSKYDECALDYSLFAEQALLLDQPDEDDVAGVGDGDGLDVVLQNEEYLEVNNTGCQLVDANTGRFVGMAYSDMMSHRESLDKLMFISTQKESLQHFNAIKGQISLWKVTVCLVVIIGILMASCALFQITYLLRWCKSRRTWQRDTADDHEEYEAL